MGENLKVQNQKSQALEKSGLVLGTLYVATMACLAFILGQESASPYWESAIAWTFVGIIVIAIISPFLVIGACRNNSWPLGRIITVAGMFLSILAYIAGILVSS